MSEFTNEKTGGDLPAPSDPPDPATNPFGGVTPGAGIGSFDPTGSPSSGTGFEPSGAPMPSDMTDNTAWGSVDIPV